MVSALGPDAETRARRRIFNLSGLKDTGQALLQVDGRPILVFRRTPAERDALQARATTGDPQRFFRSTRPDIMVLNARCTHDACVVVRNETYTGARLFCPCCTSAFDLAGRRISGPALRNLDVPPYRYLSDFEIEIGAP